MGLVHHGKATRRRGCGEPLSKTSKSVKTDSERTQEPMLFFASAKEWNSWLASHHASASGVMLKLAKKRAGTPSLTYAEALEVALVWGWIDGQKRSLDEGAWLQRFTPRRAKS